MIWYGLFVLTPVVKGQDDYPLNYFSAMIKAVPGRASGISP